MSRNLSIPAFRAMFAQETEEIFLMCLRLEHPSFDEPLLVVQNNRDVERHEGTFKASFFELSLPEDAPDVVPQVNLTVDNVDRSITDAIRNLTGRVKIVMDVVLASSPNTVEAGPFEFYMLSAMYNAQSVQATLGFEDDILNMVFPKGKYTPANSPGLFKA